MMAGEMEMFFAASYASARPATGDAAAVPASSMARQTNSHAPP